MKERFKKKLVRSRSKRISVKRLMGDGKLVKRADAQKVMIKRRQG